MKLYSTDSPYMTEEDVRDYLRRQVSLTTQKEFCYLNGLSEAYVHDCITGKRAPGPKILAALGLEKVVYYVNKRSRP